MTRPPSVRRTPPLVVDGALAVFFTVLAQVELRTGWDDGYHDGPLWLNSPLQVLVTMPLLLRSRRPRLAFVLMCVAVAIPALLTARTLLFWGDMLPLMLVVFTVARTERDGLAWAAAPLATLAGLTVALRNDEMPVTDGFFALVMFGAAQFAGQLVGRLTEQRRQLSEALSELAVEHQRRAEEAVHEERRRIAAEMHDVIAHAVSLMTIQVGAARLRLETAGQPVPSELRAAEDAGRRALAELRRTLGVMRQVPDGTTLAPLPGLAGIPLLVDRFSGTGLQVTSLIDVANDLPDSVQLAAYRIVQESLTNVARHAGQVATDVRVTSRDRELVVEVSNAPGRTNSDGGGGHGLTGMQERVAMFGGSLSTGRTSAGGFCVRARIPLPSSAAEHTTTSVGA